VARPCSICEHPRISEIDAALLADVAYRRVAKQFEASESSIYRHSKEHLPLPPTICAVEPSSASRSGPVEGPSAPEDVASINSRVDLVGYMVRTQRRTLDILEKASAAGRHETALKAIRETRGNIELISRLVVLPDAGRNRLDLNKLSQDELSVLIRASMAELSARDRETLLLERPEMAAFGPEIS
jgi:hypothetical protein